MRSRFRPRVDILYNIYSYRKTALSAETADTHGFYANLDPQLHVCTSVRAVHRTNLNSKDPHRIITFASVHDACEPGVHYDVLLACAPSQQAGLSWAQTKPYG